MVGFGGIIGFYTYVWWSLGVPFRILMEDFPDSGTAALTRLFPSLGTSQISIPTFFASVCLVGTQLVTAVCVSEAVHIPTLKNLPKPVFMSQKGKDALFRYIQATPREIKTIVSKYRLIFKPFVDGLGA
jgi:hypothetical protein